MAIEAVLKKKVQVNITEEEYDIVEELAEKYKTSKASVVREMFRRGFSDYESGKLKFES